MPWAVFFFRQACFKILANAVVTVFIATVSPQPGSVAAQEVGFLFVDVPETRNIAATGRITSIGCPFFKTFYLGADMCRIVMEGNEFAQHTAVVTQTVRKTF